MTELMNRRQVLLNIVAGVSGTMAASAMTADAAGHAAQPVAPPDAVAMLYDNTLCTGCKACMPACAEANGLPADTEMSGGLWQMPPDLNAKTKNIIKLYEDENDPGGFAFVKRQCMHCLDPACVTGCPFGALEKNTWGAVTWNSALCIGCRYCEVGCPFDVPKFEWSNWNPKIVKCEFCYDRLKGNQQPACTAVCPTGAVIFGKRNDLLTQAKDRIAEAPGKYFESRVYGEHEAGGTQVLYLSKVSFDKIGLPKLGSTSIGHYATQVSSKIYKWLSGPAIIAGVLGFLIKRNWKVHEAERIEKEKKTGLLDQI